MAITYGHILNFKGADATKNGYIALNTHTSHKFGNTPTKIIRSYHPDACGQRHMMDSRYIAVIFVQLSHKRHPVARPLGPGVGWGLGVPSFSNCLRLSLSFCMQYRVILDCAISRVYNTRIHYITNKKTFRAGNKQSYPTVYRVG